MTTSDDDDDDTMKMIKKFYRIYVDDNDDDNDEIWLLMTKRWQPLWDELFLKHNLECPTYSNTFMKIITKLIYKVWKKSKTWWYIFVQDGHWY